jgi:hypothetical protein
MVFETPNHALYRTTLKSIQVKYRERKRERERERERKT